METERLRGLRLSSGLEPGPTERSVRDLDLLVLVGVTGVGKSTVLDALREGGVRFSVLPDRRVVTDVVMIEPAAGGPVRDREERFRLTALYRETHPGGMAQALADLVVDTAVLSPPLLFDGLRGLDEVRHAAAHLPRARFVALHAPDAVRVTRLLGRGDAFDRVAGGKVGEGGELRAALAALPGATDVFTAAELDSLAALATTADPAEVLAKVRIVVSERQHYDPLAANAFLATLPGERALVLDSSVLAPAEVARRVLEWL